MSYQHQPGATILKKGSGVGEFLARIPQIDVVEPGMIEAYIHLSIGEFSVFHAVGANHAELVFARFDNSSDELNGVMLLIEYLLRVHNFIAVRVTDDSFRLQKPENKLSCPAFKPDPLIRLALKELEDKVFDFIATRENTKVN